MLVAIFGGADGARDDHAFDTALGRPLQHFNYNEPEPPIIELATVYCSGIVKSPRFMDGKEEVDL